MNTTEKTTVNSASTITLEPLNSIYTEQVSRLSVDKDQLVFVGSMNDILANVTPYVHPHLVIEQKVVVGFFLIDTHYPQHHSFAAPKSVGVRAFFIDKLHQGKGIGQRTMLALPDYVKTHYPKASDIYLTVNCENSQGYRCYINTLFEDTGELYMGGGAGPQHVMRRKLICTRQNI